VPVTVMSSVQSPGEPVSNGTGLKETAPLGGVLGTRPGKKSAPGIFAKLLEGLIARPKRDLETGSVRDAGGEGALDRGGKVQRKKAGNKGEEGTEAGLFWRAQGEVTLGVAVKKSPGGEAGKMRPSPVEAKEKALPVQSLLKDALPGAENAGAKITGVKGGVKTAPEEAPEGGFPGLKTSRDSAMKARGKEAGGPNLTEGAGEFRAGEKTAPPEAGEIEKAAAARGEGQGTKALPEEAEERTVQGKRSALVDVLQSRRNQDQTAGTAQMAQFTGESRPALVDWLREMQPQEPGEKASGGRDGGKVHRSRRGKESLGEEVSPAPESPGIKAIPGEAGETGPSLGAQEREILVELQAEGGKPWGTLGGEGSGGKDPLGMGFEEALTRELQQNLNSGIVREAQLLVRQGGEGTIKLSLRPETLGNVKIHLEMAENKITGRIVVESGDAYRAFEGELSALEQAFRDSGFEGARLNLSLGERGGQEERRDPGEEVFARFAASRYDAEQEHGARLPEGVIFSGTGGINLWV